MEISQLQNNYSADGTVVHIIIRPQRREPVRFLKSADALAGKGIGGDHYSSRNGSRQVTLIQIEHLNAVASYLGKDQTDPGQTRRNIVVRGLNLLTLKGKRFRIGDALLEYTGECHPCSRMEDNLGKGGYNAMRGHGGITARILESGTIRLGDSVTPL